MTINPPLSEKDVGRRVRLRNGVVVVITAYDESFLCPVKSVGLSWYKDGVITISEDNRGLDIIERLGPVCHMDEPSKKVEQEPELGDIWQRNEDGVLHIIKNVCGEEVIIVAHSGKRIVVDSDLFKKQFSYFTGIRAAEQPEPQLWDVWEHRALGDEVIILDIHEGDIYYSYKSGRASYLERSAFFGAYKFIRRNAVNWGDV